MPLYEYECAGCGKRFELIQKFSDPPQATCRACGGSAHRLLSPPAIQFKGSGWYVTDYARRNAGPHSGRSAPAEKSESKADSEGKTETKTDAGKPAAKASD